MLSLTSVNALILSLTYSYGQDLSINVFKPGFKGVSINVCIKVKSRVKTPNGLTAIFQSITGTLQGCMLSPFLFILYLNEFVHMCNDACPGLFINESMPSVHMPLYADDVAMVNDTISRLNLMSEFCSKYCLSINMSKTKLVS